MCGRLGAHRRFLQIKARIDKKEVDRDIKDAETAQTLKCMNESMIEEMMKQNNYIQNITRKAIELLEPWIGLDPHTRHTKKGYPGQAPRGFLSSSERKGKVNAPIQFSRLLNPEPSTPLYNSPIRRHCFSDGKGPLFSLLRRGRAEVEAPVLPFHEPLLLVVTDGLDNAARLCRDQNCRERC